MSAISALKRDADSGRMEIEFLYIFGNHVPEKVKGMRKVLGSRSYGIAFQNTDGEANALKFASWNLIDYDRQHLVVYMPDVTENGIDKTVRGKPGITCRVHLNIAEEN